MEKSKFSALLRTKSLWAWVGVGLLAVAAIGGVVLLLPAGQFEITPTLVNAQGLIEPDTAFTVKAPASMTEAKLREAVVLSQKVKGKDDKETDAEVHYRLEPVEGGGYILTPVRPLEAGGTLSVSQSGKKKTYQVAKTLIVTTFMPVNGSINVPISSGVELEFNQSNVSLADFKAAITISPEIIGEVTEGDGRFVLYPQQALAYGATYTVTLHTPLVTPSGFALREETTFTFTTITSLAEATDYLFNLTSAGNTANVLSDEAPQVMVYLDGRVTEPTIPQIDVKLYKYPTADDYMRQVDKNSGNSSYGKGGQNMVLDVTGLDEQSTFGTVPVMTADVQTGKGGMNSNQYGITFPQPLPVGHYAVEYSLTTGEKNADGTPYVIKRYQLMQSTDLSVFFMQTGDDLLLWVNNVITGAPVEGAEFELSGNIYASAVTGADGTALIHSEGMAVEDWRHNTGVFTLAVGEQIFTDSQMFSPRDTNPTRDYISYMFTDRPIYRTSDTIKVWGMVRPRNSSVKMAEEYTLKFSGADPVMVKPDAKGLFTTEISYSGINTGWGSIELMYDDTNYLASVGMSIEDYTKPVYTVSSQATKPVYLLAAGELPTANIDVSLFDGTPVPAFKGNVESWNSSVSFDPGNSIVTDAKGRATIRLKPGNSTDSWYPQSYDYRFSNADAEGQNVYEYGYIYAIHRDLMLTGTPTVKDGKAEVAITTNRVDISKVKESDDLWKDNILKGGSTSTPVTATLKKHYYNEIYIGTAYDFISRTSIPTYKYEEAEDTVEVYNVTTKGGSYILKDIPCPAQDGVSYTLELTAKDSKGGNVIYTVGLTPYNNYWRNDMGYRYSLAKQLAPEDMGLIQDEYGSRYEMNWLASSGFVDNENVTFALQRNEKPVEKMTGKLLTTTVQEGFANVTITDKDTVTLPYSEALLPNYVITGAYFDGRYAFILEDSYMSFNPKKRELEIKLEGDKKEYAPKDAVKLNATVTNKSTGKPAADAELVVAVVDEAIFALREQDTDLLNSIYRSIYYPQMSKYSSYTPPIYGGGGEKGGGGGEDVRKDFKDTAFFGTVKTDASGKAQFTFTMPDNITAWRATGLALTDDNQAGVVKSTLIATQKFYVTPVINETLLAGDSFAVGLRSAGKAMGEDDEVDYTVEVKGDNYDQTLTAKAKLRDYATVVFDPLLVGDYTVTIRASGGGGKNDAVRLPFTVIPSGVERTITQTVNLADGISVSPLRYPVRIELYNKTMSTYNRVLQNLIRNSHGARSDMRIANKYTAQIMEADGAYWYTGSAGQDITDLTTGALLSVLPYTQKDMDLTASMMLALPNVLQANLSYMDEAEAMAVGEGSLTSLYLAKAVNKQITADEIKEKLVAGVNYNLVEKLTMSTALAVLGDTETALANYEALVTPKLQKLTGVSGEEVLYITGEGTLSDKDCTAAASMLATVLEHKDAEPLILYLIQKPSQYEPYIAQQLLFLERFNPADGEKPKVSYSLDGVVKAEELGRYGLSLSLTKAQLAAADFKVLSGEIYADVYYTGGIETGADDSQRKLGITKTITPMEGGFESGKLVKITLDVDISGLDTQVGDAGLLVEDYLPTGMRFERYGATNQQGSDSFWRLQSQTGQRLRFSAWDKGTSVPIVYYVRCATPGEYVVESPYVSSGTTWGTAPRATVAIE